MVAVIAARPPGCGEACAMCDMRARHILGVQSLDLHWAVTSTFDVRRCILAVCRDDALDLVSQRLL